MERARASMLLLQAIVIPDDEDIDPEALTAHFSDCECSECDTIVLDDEDDCNCRLCDDYLG